MKFFEGFKKKVVPVAAGVIAGLSANAEGTTKTAENEFANNKTNTEDSLKNKKILTDSLESGKVQIYTKAKTEKGAITPTGLNNSFLNNEGGIKPSDIELIASKHGFRTGSVIEFQTDLFSYLQKNYPQIIKDILKKYDLPAAKNLIDGYLGVRVAYALSELDKLNKNTPEQKKEDPYARFAKNEGYSFYNSRVIGTFRYAVRKTASIEDAGMKDTGYEDVLFQPTDENLKPIGEPVIIDGETWNLINNMTGGKYFDKMSKEKLDGIIAQAKKSTTASFAGADMSVGDGGLTTNK